MGRGIEGAGNTRLSIEIEEFLKQTGNEVTIIANSEKKWPRGKVHVNDIELHDFSQAPYLDDKQYDNVIVMSVPAKKFSEAGKENFTTTLETYSPLDMTYIQVDHKLASINRNYYGEEPWTSRFFKCINKVMTNCIDNDFLTKFVARKVPQDAQNFETIGLVMISAEFDKLPKVSLAEKHSRTVSFIGRSPKWKGWTDLALLHHNHLKAAGYTTQIEGIEMSIGVLGLIFDEIKPVKIPKPEMQLMHKFNPDHYVTERDQGAMIFGPYIRNEAINRVAHAKFGAFTTFVGEQFGGMIEAAFLEMAATATPVIIKKELHDHGRLNSGERLSDFTPEELGVIIFDTKNPEATLEMLERLENDDALYRTYRENIYKFFKARFDRTVMLPLMMDVINK
jgi:hypothetical protein